MAEKLICQLAPLRVEERLQVALMRLAAEDDRTLADYCRRVLELHVFGHGRILDAVQRIDDESRASRGDAR